MIYKRDIQKEVLDPLEIDEIHYGKGISDYIDISQVYYGLKLVWEYISSNLISSDGYVLMSKDGYILNSSDND